MSEQGFIQSVADVEFAVEHIRLIAGDDESAHCAEDDLWAAVLSAIAKGADDPAALAAAALNTVTIEFSRWYA